MEPEFKKTFSEIIMPNKDIIVLVRYAHNCTATFEYCYNGISGTYMGLKADTFIDSIRGLLYVCPDFFQIMDHKYSDELKRMGFEKTTPSPQETAHYALIATALY